MPRPPHPSCFDHPSNIGEAYKLWSSPLCNFLQLLLQACFCYIYYTFRLQFSRLVFILPSLCRKIIAKSHLNGVWQLTSCDRL